MAYFWGWPMANIQSRLETFRPVKEFALGGGVLPIGPVNEITMLTDYIDPADRAVACPNQDVVYGQGILDLAREPVVVQVPDFRDRFCVYQVGDQRTDGFAELGNMYGTSAGPVLDRRAGLEGEGRRDRRRVPFAAKADSSSPASSARTADADRQAVQPLVRQIMRLPVQSLRRSDEDERLVEVCCASREAHGRR